MCASTAPALDQTYLKQRLEYEPSTGELTWKYYEKHGKKWNNRFAGGAAGSVKARKSGYRNVRVVIDGKDYVSSRLIWLYMTGSWPVGQVDHIDHNPMNNRWANLREVTAAENMKNLSMTKSNTSGVTGVYWHKRGGKWGVTIDVRGKRLHGGLFAEFEDAVARRKELEALHDFHSNHGKPI